MENAESHNKNIFDWMHPNNEQSVRDAKINFCDSTNFWFIVQSFPGVAIVPKVHSVVGGGRFAESVA